MLKTLPRLFRVVGLTVSSEAEDSPDSTPPARAWRSMQTGQDSIAPESSLPQIGQVRRGSVFMGLTAVRMYLAAPTSRYERMRLLTLSVS